MDEKWACRWGGEGIDSHCINSFPQVDLVCSDADRGSQPGGVSVPGAKMGQGARPRRKRIVPDTTVVDDDFSHEDPLDRFQRAVFYPVLDCVVGNLTTRYEAARNLDKLSRCFMEVSKYV